MAPSAQIHLEKTETLMKHKTNEAYGIAPHLFYAVA
jgi:hypothetical protein